MVLPLCLVLYGVIFLRGFFKKHFTAITGMTVGICNGLFGSGGGMTAVPMLEKGGMEPKKAHATSIAITLPLSVISGMFYFGGGNLRLIEAIKFIPLGLAGAAVGSIFMKKLSNKLLKRVFSALMIIAGIRIFMK